MARDDFVFALEYRLPDRLRTARAVVTREFGQFGKRGHVAIGGQLGRQVVGERAVFHEVARLVVEEQPDALAREQLALGGVLLVILFAAARACTRRELFQIGVFHRGTSMESASGTAQTKIRTPG